MLEEWSSKGLESYKEKDAQEEDTRKEEGDLEESKDDGNEHRQCDSSLAEYSICAWRYFQRNASLAQDETRHVSVVEVG